MKRFTIGTPCPKCGSHTIMAQYKSYPGRIEIMRRECQRCGYSWNELPLDAPGDDE